MDHFHYVDGRLHAESVPLADIAETIGTPFYCYSTATLTRHFTVFRDAFGDLPVTVCFAVKANGTVGVLRTLAGPGRRGGRGVGRRDDPRAGRRDSGRAHRLFRGRQDQGRTGRRAQGRNLADQRRIGTRNRDVEPRRHVARRRRGEHRGPNQSRHRRQDAPQDHHRQEREQVRHRMDAGQGDLRPRRVAAGNPPGQRRHAYRLAVARRGTVPRRVRTHARRRPDAARRGARHRTRRPGWRARHSVHEFALALDRILCRRGPRRVRRSGLSSRAGTRTGDRRQTPGYWCRAWCG